MYSRTENYSDSEVARNILLCAVLLSFTLVNGILNTGSVLFVSENCWRSQTAETTGDEQ